MKKISFFMLLLPAFFCPGVFAQNFSEKMALESGVVQILLPKTVYVGDRCELKYVFRTEADLFENEIFGSEITSLDLLTDWPVFNSLSEKCHVYRVTLEHTGFEYALTLFFIPWQVGQIDFSSFDLSSLVRASLERQETAAGFFVDFAPVTVNSLAEKLKVSSPPQAQGPVTVPGTSFLLILIAAVFLVIAGAVVFLFLRIPYFFMLLVIAGKNRKIRKAYKLAVKQINRLLREQTGDDEFCTRLLAYVREFLCVRFDEEFSSLTCSHFYEKFESFACGSLSENQNQAVANLVDVFGRGDYVRFAKGSVDSFRTPASLYEAVLAEGEREILVTLCLESLKIFTFSQENEANAETSAV